MTNVLMALEIIARLAALIERAVRSGGEIDDAHMAAALSRANAADEAWANANKEKSE